MQVLLVVRHARAGSKDRWRGDDSLRPLTRRGRAEAIGLVDLLSPYGPRRIVSSPYLRCTQTVEPLSEALGSPIERSERLVPSADGRAVLLVRELAVGEGPIVVCTHGETIEALQRRLGRGRKWRFHPGAPHEKGSVWVLHAAGDRFVEAAYVPPLA